MFLRALILFISIVIIDIPLHASYIEEYEMSSDSLMLREFSIGRILESEKTTTIDEILLRKEVLPTESRFVLDPATHHWYTFRIKNSSSKTIERFIGFDEAFMEVADLYVQHDTSIVLLENGLKVPIRSRTIKNRCPVFLLNLEPNQEYTIYLHAFSQFSGVVGIFMSDRYEFALSEQRKLMAYWAYFGGAFAIMLYNLFLFVYIRARIYFYYLMNVLGIITFTFLYSGYFLYASSDVDLYYKLHVSSAVIGIALGLFTKELLRTHLLNSWVNKLLNILILAYALLAVLILVDIRFYEFLLVFSVPSIGYLLFVGIFSLKVEIQLSKFYLIAMGTYLLGLCVIALVSIGMLPFNDFTRYGFIAGSFIELTVFSLALAYRVKQFQEEKLHYQNELLGVEKKLKSELEDQVLIRTQDLIRVGDELKQSNQDLALQIDEKNKALEALKISEIELQKSNDTKDKFFSIIAHDLKSPFMSILGYLDLLESNYHGLDESQKKSMISSVNNGASQTYLLLENLLIWSRTQIKNMEYTPSELNLNELLEENIDLLGQFSETKNVKLELAEIGIKKLIADRDMLGAVVRNLLTNSIKYSKSGQKVLIGAGIVKENGAQAIELYVKDNGIGMDQKRISRLFTIEENMSTPGTNKERGTGLGLILCKEFVEMHQGEISVESELGVGSTFKVRIPQINTESTVE